MGYIFGHMKWINDRIFGHFGGFRVDQKMGEGVSVCTKLDSACREKTSWSLSRKFTPCAGNVGSIGRRFLGHCGPDQPRILTEVLGHSLIRSFLHRSFVRLSALLASLPRFAALTHSLAHLLCSLPPLWDSEQFNGYLFCFFFHFGP